MKNLKLLSIPLLILIGTILSVPIPSLDLNYSKIVLDKNGNLLSAKIALDEQWRFPIKGAIPKPLEECILYFEDEYFYWHIGINPISLVKSFYANWKADRIVRGGSTITMQLMRMYRGNKSRNYSQKLIEMLGSLKLELLYSKADILKMWASIAPFGGNTVGASTASWRYFGRSLNTLSWSEYATLAVLPNSPSRIHMQKNLRALTSKRNHLLNKLYINDKIDSIDYVLALNEDIKFNRKPLNGEGIHFLDFVVKEHPEVNIFNSTIDPYYQNELNNIVQHFSKLYQQDGINNASALIIDYKKNELLAYVANSKHQNQLRHVDCIQAPRSYGSLLKPILYSYAIEQGYFLPNEIIKDIPTNFNGFIPKNFDRKHRGSVAMSEMVSHSLNVPAVRVLNYVGLESFHDFLIDDLDFKYINEDPFHHGLSIILGGAEASMWNLANTYKGIFRNYYDLNDAFGNLNYLKSQVSKSNELSFDPSVLNYTIQAMKSVNRPKEEQHFAKLGGGEIAWKTGTSYGHRDAWAIGANGQYLVAIWIGNEDGEGVFNLTGGQKAAPVLFKTLRYLEHAPPLTQTITDSKRIEICKESGMMKGKLCNKTKHIDIHRISHQLRNCDHHIKQNNTNDTLFCLSPIEEYYYSEFYGIEKNIIDINSSANQLSIVYPQANSILFIPKKMNQEYSKIELKANSLDEETELFWFINDEFIEKTIWPHSIFTDLNEGIYALQVNDKNGNEEKLNFSVSKR